MSIEEQTVEVAGERCEVCGARLTQAEIELALERGGPSLCAVHAEEEVEPDETEEE